MPICKLSFHGDWTPLNRIFYNQCIQDSDEERSFYSQRKKWKRKRYPYRNGKIRRKYIIYEYVSSSESEVSLSDEFNSTDNYERNIKNKSISDEPEINASDEYVDSHYEERVKIKKVFDDYKSCSEHEVHMSDELNSADEQERNIKRSNSDKPNINSSDEYDDPCYEGIVRIDNDKSCLEPEVHMSDELNSADEQERNIKRSNSDKPNINSSDEYDDPRYEGRIRIDDDKSCLEPEVHMSDELNSADEQERNIKRSNSDKPNINSSDEYDDPRYEGRIRIDDDKSCLEPEVHMFDKLNSADEQEEKERSKRLFYEYRSCSDSEVNVPDEHNLSDENNENNMHLKKSAVKYEKYTANKNDSSDEWEMPSSDEKETHSNTSNDYYDSSDSCDDYEVTAKKKKNQKSKKGSKRNVKSLKPKDSVNKAKNKKPDIGKLSEYEKMVQKNRDEKIAFLQSLKMDEVKEGLNEAISNLKPKRFPRKSNIERKIFQNLGNDLMGEVDESIKTKADKEIEKVCRQSARQKNLLKKKEENFASSPSYNELPSVLSFEEALKKGHVYHDFISEVSGSECKIPQLLDNDYVSHFEKMTLQESQVISCSSISSMVVHESQEKIIICTGNGNGEIIFWHVNSDYDFSAFQPHLQRVSCLKFNPYSPNVIISSSVDGTMYCGDFEKKIFYQVFKAECCNHFDFLSPTSYLVAHGIRYVSVVDIRTHGKTFKKRHKCNEDTVKTASLHPINKNYFISAHQKGAVRLWDLRKLQNEPVIEVYCKGKNLISSSFSPVTGNSVLVTMSDAICLLDSSSLSKEFILKESIEHDNFVIWRTPFQATWLPNNDDTFVVGSRFNPRRIEIFDDKLCNFFNFTDERFNYIAAVNAFHSSLPLLASASIKRISIFSESE